MKFTEFEKIISRITYKPNFKITTTIHNELSLDAIRLRLVCSMLVPDVRDPYTMITVSNMETFTLEFIKEITNEEILGIVKNLIRNTEEHELDEWLMVDGVRLVETHRYYNPT